ncbi:MAG: PAAR domain-containing protein [Rhodospirillales bacterium]|nr:PAAR domain-containing protein [Rhodospirillales bacterium]
MPAVSRVGDTGSHGGSYIGQILSGSSNVQTNGIATAYVGSSYYCPEHGTNSISSSPVSNVIVDGNAIAVVGSVCVCGAVIDTGSPNVNAN